MVSTKKEKSRLGLDDEILGGTGGHADTPLALVATVADSESLDDFRLFALGALADFAPLITHRADGFAGLVAHCHPFDLATLGTFLVRGRVFVIAFRTDGFAGFTISMDSSALPANITSTLHGYTSFRFLDFGKSEFRSPDLTSYPTLLVALRQGHLPGQNRPKRKKKFLWNS